MNEPSPARVAHYRDLVRSILRDSVGNLGLLALRNSTPQQLAAAAIYATILQSTDEASELLRRSSVVTVGGTLRSILESYADLSATINHDDYPVRLVATFYAEKLRFLKNMRRSPENEMHADLASHIDVEGGIERLSGELAALGAEPLKIIERFELGGHIDLYESLYWQLCLQGHNNISAIEARHVRSTGENAQLVIFKETSPGELAMYFDVLSATLTDAALRIHSFFRTAAIPLFEAHAVAMRKYRDDPNRDLENEYR